jgi:hypothetical protein
MYFLYYNDISDTCICCPPLFFLEKTQYLSVTSCKCIGEVNTNISLDICLYFSSKFKLVIEQFESSDFTLIYIAVWCNNQKWNMNFQKKKGGWGVGTIYESILRRLRTSTSCPTVKLFELGLYSESSISWDTIPCSLVSHLMFLKITTFRVKELSQARNNHEWFIPLRPKAM